MKKTIITTMLVVSLILVLISGCGNKDASSDAELNAKGDAAIKTVSANPMLEWVPLTGVDEEIVRVYDNGELIAQKRNAKNPIDYNDIVPNTPLVAGKTYTWEVIGTKDGQPVKKSSSKSFTVE